MPKKTRGRKREGEEDASEPQPCCIFACERFGTRLLTSLRASYQLKEEHSGRVCEGHYRRDLRRFKKHSELNGSPSSTKSSRRAQKDQDSDSMMVDGEDSKSASSSRSSSPIDSAYHEASSPMSDHSHHAAPFYPYFKPQPVVAKIETPAIATPAFAQVAPATCASLAGSSAIVGSPSFDLAQVNKFKMFCDFVLRNEGVTH